MTIFETIERARKHYQQLSPHIKERETAKHLRALLLIVDASRAGNDVVEEAMRQNDDTLTRPEDYEP